MQLCYRPMTCLALFTVVLAFISTGTEAYNKAQNCCTEVSKQEITAPIIGVKIQNKVQLPCVKAVIFETENGELFCSHWRETWVRSAIKKLENDRKMRIANASLSS